MDSGIRQNDGVPDKSLPEWREYESLLEKAMLAQQNFIENAEPDRQPVVKEWRIRRDELGTNAFLSTQLAARVDEYGRQRRAPGASAPVVLVQVARQKHPRSSLPWPRQEFRRKFHDAR